MGWYRRDMKEINEAANMWNKTKDPKYKDLWYKLIKEYVERTTNTTIHSGTNATKTTASTNTS